MDYPVQEGSLDGRQLVLWWVVSSAATEDQHASVSLPVASPFDSSFSSFGPWVLRGSISRVQMQNFDRLRMSHKSIPDSRGTDMDSPTHTYHSMGRMAKNL